MRLKWRKIHCPSCLGCCLDFTSSSELAFEEKESSIASKQLPYAFTILLLHSLLLDRERTTESFQATTLIHPKLQVGSFQLFKVISYAQACANEKPKNLPCSIRLQAHILNFLVRSTQHARGAFSSIDTCWMPHTGRRKGWVLVSLRRTRKTNDYKLFVQVRQM